MAPDQKIVALVPAGDRSAGDPVAKVSGVTSKVLAPLAGTPMIIRVLNALQTTGRVDTVVLCGPDRDAVESCPPLQEVLNKDNVAWVPAERSLAGSVQAGLAGIDPGALVLITTADHALLDAGTLDYFLDRVVESHADVSVGLVDYALVRRAYPGVRRTVLKFSDGGYCGCNLYALNGSRAREIISLWQRTQAYRKRPWRMALGLLGFRALARYACGRLSLQQTRQAIMKATGVNVDFIDLPFPHAGIDIDTPEDLDLAKQILEQRH
ncbi:MAG: NTP transferase domain-containing protein [Gammaproteobacteria bacterium]|nr:NTP transferase domain-containing protein [Gammaproteobacteria bacterium]